MSTLSTDDEDEATIAVTISTSSPTFFLSPDSPIFEIFVLFEIAQIIQSTRPGQSITMAIDDCGRGAVNHQHWSLSHHP